jgi:hypothetical protein
MGNEGRKEMDSEKNISYFKGKNEVKVNDIAEYFDEMVGKEPLTEVKSIADF